MVWTITMEPNLVEWINHHFRTANEKTVPIVPLTNQRRHLRDIRKKAECVPWIQDVMRHSYASHWLKAYEDKNRLLVYMGHATDDMLLNNYLRAVDKKTALAYWQIKPSCLKPAPAKKPPTPEELFKTRMKKMGKFKVGPNRENEIVPVRILAMGFQRRSNVQQRKSDGA